MPASIALTTSAAIGGEFRRRRSRLSPADGRPSGGTGGGGGLRHREPGPPGTAAGAALPLACALRLPLSPGPTRTRNEGGVSSSEGSAPAERSCIIQKPDEKLSKLFIALSRQARPVFMGRARMWGTVPLTKRSAGVHRRWAPASESRGSSGMPPGALCHRSNGWAAQGFPRSKAPRRIWPKQLTFSPAHPRR